MIVKGLHAVAKKQGGHVVMDEELLEEVVYLVEYPTPLYGCFDTDYLELPEAQLLHL